MPLVGRRGKRLKSPEGKNIGSKEMGRAKAREEEGIQYTYIEEGRGQCLNGKKKKVSFYVWEASSLHGGD